MQVLEAAQIGTDDDCLTWRKAKPNPAENSPGRATFVVKDNFDIVGLPTTAGSAALAHSDPAPVNAVAVDRLIAAGFTLTARAKMHELAYGVTGINRWSGTPANPLYPDLVPGGSSSGSACAVARGLCDFALGTDTGGSVRVPATCCGIVGLKPSFGRVDHGGVHPSPSSLDCIGVFARNVARVEQVMTALADNWQTHALPSARPKAAFFAPAGDRTICALARMAAQAAFALNDVELAGFDAAANAGLTIIAAETAACFGHLTASGMLGEDVQARLLAATRITAADLAEAEAIRRQFTARVDAVLESHDVIALPGIACPVPSLAEAERDGAPGPITLACRPFNLSGHPAIVLPVGEIAGRPVSLQLVGRRNGDEALCAMASLVDLFDKEGGESQ